MFLAATANRAILACSVDGENSSFELLLECEATEASGTLEIGEDHIFASKRNIGFAKKRRSWALRLYVRRRDGLSEKAAAKLRKLLQSSALAPRRLANSDFTPTMERRIRFRRGPRR
jgi:hypothetical protein